MSLFSYYTLVFLLAIGMFVCGLYANKMEGELAKRVSIFEFAALTPSMFCIFYMLTQEENMAYLFRAVFALGIDIMLQAFTLFVVVYTGDFRRIKWLEKLMVIYTILDTVSYGLNISTHHAFTLKAVDNKMGGVFYMVEHRGITDYIHIAVTYVIMFVVFLILLYHLVNVSPYNRFKYLSIFAVYAFAIVANIALLNTHFVVDLSLPVFEILSILVFYLPLFYVPRGMREQLLLRLTSDLEQGIVCFDVKGKVSYINETAKKILNAQKDVTKLEDYLVRWQRENQDVDKINFREEVEVNGELKYYNGHYEKLYDDDDNWIGTYFSMIDCSSEVFIASHAEYRMSHDMLTELYNREYYFKEAERVLKENPDEEYLLIVSDIKDFKLINDLFGVERGDEVLKREAELIKDYSNEGTVYGRLEADKFSVLVRKSVFSETLILDNVYRMGNQFTNSVYRMQIYVGIYEVKDHNENVSVMCDKANLAISELKGEFGRVIAYYRDSMMNRTLREKRWISEFNYALDNNQLKMYLQPQTDANGKLLGAEALVRWIHPEEGSILPMEFIPAFEKSGLIKQLDLFMWNQAVDKLKEWKDKGFQDIYISVNISAKDFYYIDIYRTLTMLVDNHEINPYNLKLEITETAMMSEVQLTIPLLSRLQRFGFQVELDDFGSGYSSLNTLKDIRADILKLDMGLVRETENRERSRAILASIIQLAEKLGMKVIAEGVESKEQLEILEQLGCDQFQGYYFSEPLSVEEFEKKYLL